MATRTSKRPSDAGSARGATSRSRRAPEPEPGGITRAIGRIGEHVGEQRSDVWGVALMLVAVLTGLGVYSDAAGPVGDGLTALVRGSVGLAGFVVPPLLAVLALLVILDRPAPTIGRLVIGGTLAGAGVLGGAHIALGRPGPRDGLADLWEAGGLVGWAVATPLEWAMSTSGAWAVLVALAVLGISIATRLRLRRVLDGIGAGFARAREARRARAEARAIEAELIDGDDPDGVGLEDSPTVVPSGVVGDRIESISPANVRATLASQRATQPPLDAPLTDADHTVVAGGPARSVVLDEEATDAVVLDEERTVPVGRRGARRPSSDALLAADAELEDVDGEDGGDDDGATIIDLAPARRRARKVASPGARADSDYTLPPMDLLAEGKLLGGESVRTIEGQTTALQETFDQFGIDATVARWSRGPTVTRFEIELGPGVQVKKVANLGDDIAYALAAPDVRIVAPIPGKSAIGVEVPNRQRDLITLGDVLRSDEARRDTHPMTVAIGVDIAGKAALVNLATMPHLLVSGATGSGKSVTLNGMIASIIMRTRPDQVRMLLIDPKRVELGAYDGAPHLLAPVVTDPRRAADAVQWCVKEMEQRYELLALLGFRNIDGYNDAYDEGRLAARPGPDGTEVPPRRLPYVLLVIDELADLMLVAPRDVEDAICRIAQMARAVGIHMLIATQRPSVDVITGLIKANIPSRLALAVASQTDSRTILDMGGAEKLVGKGDMLFLPASQGKPSRLQGCWVSEREIEGVVAYCRAQREAEFEPAVARSVEGSRGEGARDVEDGSDEALVRRAAEQVIATGLGSTSMLQRKLRIGFARAGRLMDELELLGVVGPNEGSKAREVLWSEEMLEAALAEGML